MAILNVTPDSFSDGGRHASRDAAIAAGRAMLQAGADILDIGGESTRPGATEVDPAIEQARVLPVIEALAAEGLVSIDTRHASTMRAAIAAGARIVNDVSALSFDPEALGVVAGSDVGVVLMHMRGTPADMMGRAMYRDVVAEVVLELGERIEACVAAGIARHRIVVDPGIGFAKTGAQNLELLARLDVFGRLGAPVLIGVSRKGFIGQASGERDPERRLPGSLAALLAGVARGAKIVRVHDVAETRQALAVWTAVEDARGSLAQAPALG